MSAGIIKTRKQPFQLFRPDGNYFFPGSRPGEPVLLQTLMPDAKSVVIPVKDFDHVTPTIAENIQIPRKGILPHDLLNHNGKTVDGFSHVCAAHGEKNSVGLNGEHHIAETSRISCGNVARDAFESSSIVKPFGVITRTTGDL